MYILLLIYLKTIYLGGTRSKEENCRSQIKRRWDFQKKRFSYGCRCIYTSKIVVFAYSEDGYILVNNSCIEYVCCRDGMPKLDMIWLIKKWKLSEGCLDWFINLQCRSMNASLQKSKFHVQALLDLTLESPISNWL